MVVVVVTLDIFQTLLQCCCAISANVSKEHIAQLVGARPKLNVHMILAISP